MKQTFAIAILAAALTGASAAEQSPVEALAEARELARSGQHKAALEKHVWYHENALRLEPAQFGVRLSFALSDWKRLGVHYPPAIDKMKEIRDRGDRLLREGKDDFQLFMEVAALNATLDVSSKTTELFKLLDDSRPRFAGRLFHVAMEQLIADKEFGLCSKHVTKPLQLVESYIESYRRSSSSVGQRAARIEDPEARKQFADMARRNADERFISQTEQLIEVVVKSDRKNSAKEVRLAALKVKDDERIRSAIKRFKE